MTDERLTEEAAKRDALADAFDDMHRVTEGGCDTRGDDVAAMVLRLGFGRSEAPSADDIRVAVLHAVKKGARSDSEATRNYQEAERIIRAAIPHLLNTDAPTVHEVTPDEREALVRDLRAHSRYAQFSSYGTHRDFVGTLERAADLIAGLRRPEVPEPSADRDEITDEALWDFADDLLDAWNIEDTNAPSLAEDFRDRFVARFHPSYRSKEQGEPSDARGIIARALMGEARMGSFSAWDLADDIVAALRAAGTVR